MEHSGDELNKDKETISVEEQQDIGITSSDLAFGCHHCIYGFVSYLSLKSHILTHHLKELEVPGKITCNERKKLHSCSLCNYSTIHSYYMKRHKLTKHINAKPYHCTLCNFKTIHSISLQIHKLHKHANEKTYSCSVCDFKTYKSGVLKRHMLSRHFDNNLFHCSLCDYRSIAMNKLENHVIAKHTKELANKCSVCNFKSVCSISLKKHMRVRHTNKKLYPFPEYDYKCLPSPRVKTRVLSLRIDKKPCQCTCCGFITAYPETLRHHILTLHSDVKPPSLLFM